uniref:Uncharacterized protein n=1 Tax=Cyprinus carpio carpio TaxID=630221 RepID=A0A9J7Y0Y6_CYPCA
MSDKSTQTPSFWPEDGGEAIIHKRSASWGSADHLIEIAKLRQQLQRSLQGSHSIKEKEEEVTPQPKRLSASSSNMVLSRPVICRMPSYSDGVNQELENVFICEDWGREEEKALEVRDGGRAPVPPLHHTHSTETQISCSPCYCCSPAADAERGVVHLCLSSPALPNQTTVTHLNVSLPRAARKSKCLKISSLVEHKAFPSSPAQTETK